MYRYLAPGVTCVASVMSYVTYPPSPTLVFTCPVLDGAPMAPLSTDIIPVVNTPTDSSGMPHFRPDSYNDALLLAQGTLLTVDPNRIILKRTILTGHPYKVHRRSSVLRYMFYNPDDIKYFMKVELYTKNGLTGHIKEPVGMLLLLLLSC